MNNNNNIGVTLAIIVALVIAGYAFYGGNQQSTTSNESISTSTNATSPMSTTTTKLADGLEVTILQEGSGEPAKVGQEVTVNYTGTLENGTKFDSSYDHGQPFEFQLGAGQVIRGWDEGVLGMKPGEKRKLVIPSQLGYGSEGIGPIPANATLIFEVELVSAR